MGERNFSIDLVDLFANIVDGEFFEGVHHFSHGPGGSLSASGGLVRLRRACTPLAGCYFCPDYPFNLSLKSFLSG